MASKPDRSERKTIRLGARLLGLVIGAYLVIGVVAAQECVFPPGAADGLSLTIRDISIYLIIGAIVVALIAVGMAGLKRDPNEKAGLDRWRNRAAMGIGLVIFIPWFLANLASRFGVDITCVDFTPFF